jgi:solute carrier family 20 (sodium-dependent phosphate transporter)
MNCFHEIFVCFHSYWRRFFNFVCRKNEREINAPELDDPQQITRSLEIKRVNYLFRFLQTLTTGFVSFVHGGNDVSNTISPLVGIYIIYETGSASLGQVVQVPSYMLLLSGIAIAIGLNSWGGRVIKTVGHQITTLTPTM